MHPEIARLLAQAEERYLQKNELELFRRYAASLSKRIETYQTLRDKEEKIFQPVADKLVEAFPDRETELLERGLKHWLLISRYCTTAMLLSDPEYLEIRLQDWIKRLVETHQTQDVERKLYEILNDRLKQEIPEKQLALIHPFFEKAKSILFEERTEKV